jgi:hypothetical protein
VRLLRRGDHLCVNLCTWGNFGALLCCARGELLSKEMRGGGGKLFYLRRTVAGEGVPTSRGEGFGLRAGTRGEGFGEGLLRAGTRGLVLGQGQGARVLVRGYYEQGRGEGVSLRAAVNGEGLLSRSPNYLRSPITIEDLVTAQGTK